MSMNKGPALLFATMLVSAAGCAARIPPPPPPPPPQASAAPPSNHGPAASVRCGPCQVLPGGSALLAANATDADGDPLTYFWTAPSGVLQSANERATTWTAPSSVPTTGVTVPITVHVSDRRGGVATDTVILVVHPAGTDMSALLPQPQFPLSNFPQPSERFHLDESLVTRSDTDTLHDVAERLREILDRAGIGRRVSFYWLQETGFAAVTRLERILDDGTPLEPPARWDAQAVQPDFGTFEWLKSIFVPARSRFRFFVFLATPEDVVPSREGTSFEVLQGVAHGGVLSPPTSMQQVPVAADLRIEIFIYEFFRPTEFDTESFVTRSNIDSTDHIVRAGLWTREQLVRR